jgi:hypothetical protein
MRKLFFTSVVFLLAIASMAQKDVKALYEKNLAALKAGIALFEKEDIKGFAATLADTIEFNSPAYGDTVKTKAHYVELLQSFVDSWDNLKLTNTIFLPGLDSATHQMDGSVRYYGVWRGVHKSGKATAANFYGSYDFNKDGKVSSATEFFDVGGMINAVSGK